MANENIAKRYATCLIEIAQERKLLNEVYNDVQLILQTLETNENLALFLNSPIDNQNQKPIVLEKTFSKHIQPISLQFLLLVLKKRRENLLKDITLSFINLYNQLLDIHPVHITTAVELNPIQIDTFIKKISAQKKFKTIQIKTKINADLIGGFILEFDNQSMDTSIKKDLNLIRNQFIKNEFKKSLK